MPATSLVSSIIHTDQKSKIWSKMFPPSQNNFMVTVYRHVGFLSPLSCTAPVAHIRKTFGIRCIKGFIKGTIGISVHQTILLSTILIYLDSHAQEVIFSHIAKSRMAYAKYIAYFTLICKSISSQKLVKYQFLNSHWKANNRVMKFRKQKGMCELPRFNLHSIIKGVFQQLLYLSQWKRNIPLRTKGKIKVIKDSSFFCYRVIKHPVVNTASFYFGR